MYEFTDAATELLRRRALRSFDRFASVIPADEINVLNGVKNLYKKIAKDAKRCYNEIVEHYYFLFDGKAGFFCDDLVTDYLEEGYDPVAKYVFARETERKAARLAEGLIADPNCAEAEIRKAKYLWGLQATHFAIRLSDLAQIRAYESRGISYVRWVTNVDGKECRTCRDRHGKIYPLQALPAKPHYNCRCTIRPAKKEQYDRQKRTASDR